jgi:rod shape determining protein RodA
MFLVTMGIACIYSSGINSEGISVSNEYIKQIIWAGFGFILLILFAAYDYRKFQRAYFWLFGLMIALLIYTRLFGRYVNGARSWIGIGDFGIQPSEFCKILYILFFAQYLENSQKEEERKRFIFSLLILCVPVGLILLQPDLGTASVYIPIFLVMCFMADIPIRYLLIVLTSGVLTILFTVIPVWQSEIAQINIPAVRILTNDRLRFLLILALGAVCIIGFLGKFLYKNNKYYYWISYVFGILSFSLISSIGAKKVLKDYQIKRLIVYLNPQIDPLGSGWNIIQSKIAIGSGNIFGRGFLHGTQSHYRFLPQQSTDFIFSILSEEFGFIGGIFIFSLYLIILLRTIWIIRSSNNKYGEYIAAGIFGMFLFHFFVNVGMVMGIMPITGIPLLFLSYGGSSLWTAMICIGLLMSIKYRYLDYSTAY